VGGFFRAFPPIQSGIRRFVPVGNPASHLGGFFRAFPSIQSGIRRFVPVGNPAFQTGRRYIRRFVPEGIRNSLHQLHS